MTTYDPFRGYDQWKTASPYDEDCAADFEIEAIAEKNLPCPACDYHGNTSIAQWTIETESPSAFNELIHDEITFAGWHCEECDWAQEAIDADYDRLREYKKTLKPRIDAINRVLANRKRKPALTVDEFFKSLPKRDFNFQDGGAGDWHVYCCGEKDCPVQWHKTYPTYNIGRENGLRYVELGSTDSGRNHDLDASYDERPPYNDKPNDFHHVGLTLANETDDYFRGWAEYWIDCSYTQKDPLNEYFGTPLPQAEWIEFCITSAENFAKHLK